MGGQTQEKQVTNTSNTQAGTQTGQTTPWGPASGLLAQLLGQAGGVNANLSGAETSALNSLTASGQAGNPFAGQIGGVANTLLSGGGPDRTGLVSGAYDTLQRQLGPTANGAYLDPSTNPFFAQTTQGITDQATKALKGIYAGSGRDPGMAGGDFSYNLGNGISTALAPVYANQYNAERTNQLGAINSLFGGGNTAAGNLSALDQTRLGNMQAGIGAAGSAWDAQNAGSMQVLAAEAQRRGIPLTTLQTLLGLSLPAAQAFGTNSANTYVQGSGTSDTTKQTDVPLFDKLLAAGAAGAGAYGKFSDRRLKRDISQVGALFDGTPVYSYRYLWSDAHEIGVMADEVEPDAVSDINGFAVVDYAKATERSRLRGMH